MIFYTCCCRVNVPSQIRTSRIRRLLPLGRSVYLEITGAESPSVPTHHRPHQDNTSTEPSGVFLESSAKPNHSANPNTVYYWWNFRN